MATRKAGAIKDYSDHAKVQWRNWVWNRIRERVKPSRDTTIVYLLGPEPRKHDIAEALKRGYKEHNLVGVDADQQNVENARRDGLLAIHADLDTAIMAWSRTWQVDVVLADFCGGLSRNAVAFLEAVQLRDPFNGALLFINSLKGRDGLTNGVRKLHHRNSRVRAWEILNGKEWGTGEPLVSKPQLDNGKGIRDPKIRQQARKRGVISPGAERLAKIVQSDRMNTIVHFLATRIRTSVELAKERPSGIDSYSYKSGHNVYETLMIRFERKSWEQLNALRPEDDHAQVVQVDQDGNITAEKPMREGETRMQHYLRNYYTAKVVSHLRGMSGEEIDDKAAKEYRRIQKVRKSIPAIRAHQTRRKTA